MEPVDSIQDKIRFFKSKQQIGNTRKKSIHASSSKIPTEATPTEENTTEVDPSITKIISRIGKALKNISLIIPNIEPEELIIRSADELVLIRGVRDAEVKSANIRRDKLTRRASMLWSKK